MNNLISSFIILLGILLMIFSLNLKNIIPKSIAAIILIFIAMISFFLESRYFTSLEYDGADKNKIVRIDSEKFKKNPYKELKRYIEDASYYNNMWRISAMSSSLICILALVLLDISTIYLIPIWLSIFTINSQIWNIKNHHCYNFIFKSLSHALDHLIKNKTCNNYTQISHRTNH